jgi:acetyltransferase-like isoleucine patch superfamily enzyme
MKRGHEAGLHRYAPASRSTRSNRSCPPPELPAPATDLDLRVDIGANVVILPSVTIGRGAISGAAAVVARDGPVGSVPAGVPARVMRQRRDREQ